MRKLKVALVVSLMFNIPAGFAAGYFFRAAQQNALASTLWEATARIYKARFIECHGGT